MKQFPLIEKYLPGLPVKDFPQKFITRKLIEPVDLEAILASGVEVFGPEHDLNRFSVNCKRNEKDRFSGLLLNYKPIEKEQPVTKDEIIEEFMKLMNSANVDFDETHALIRRLKATKELR